MDLSFFHMQKRKIQKMTEFGQAITLGYRNSFDFSGRATRSEYWWFILFNVLVGIFAVVASAFLLPSLLLYVIFGLATLPANLSVQFRRVRDAGGSPLWPLSMWISMVAYLSAIIFTMSQQFRASYDIVQDPNRVFNEPTMNNYQSTETLLTILGAAYLVISMVCFVYTLMVTKTTEAPGK